MNSAAQSYDNGPNGRDYAAGSIDAPAVRHGWHPEAWRTQIVGGGPPAWSRRLFEPGIASTCKPVERIDIASGKPLRDDLRGALAALGNFDGLHLGHQKVISRAVEMARERHVAAVVMTFDPHPVRHFKPDAAGFALTTFEQRRRLLRNVGIDAIVVFPFNDDLAKITPAAFVHDCLGELGGVVTGSNFAFGHRRAGSVETLTALAREHGMASDAVGPVGDGNAMVSSSRIRAALRAGDCAEAARLLTRPFAIEGVIGPGRMMDPARKLFSASMDLRDYLRPRCGLYTVRAWLDDGRMLRGSAQISASTEADPRPPLELFLAGLLEPDLGRQLAVELIAYRRDAAERHDPMSLNRCIAAPHRVPLS